MTQIKRIGLDTSKAVFTLHCVDQTGRAVPRTNLRRACQAVYNVRRPKGPPRWRCKTQRRSNPPHRGVGARRKAVRRFLWLLATAFG